MTVARRREPIEACNSAGKENAEENSQPPSGLFVIYDGVPKFSRTLPADRSRRLENGKRSMERIAYTHGAIGVAMRARERNAEGGDVEAIRAVPGDA